MGVRRRWTVTAILLLAAEAALLFWLDVAFGLSGLLHAAFLDGASIAWTALAALVPSWLGTSLGALVGFLGLGWLYQHLIGPSLSGNAGAGLSTVGGALVAPVYFGVRRLLFTAPKAREEGAAADSASADSRMTKVFEAVVPASTAVQEPL